MRIHLPLMPLVARVEEEQVLEVDLCLDLMFLKLEMVFKILDLVEVALDTTTQLEVHQLVQVVLVVPVLSSLHTLPK